MTGCKGNRPRIGLGEFTLDPGDERLWGASGEIRIGNKAFQVLSRLAEEQGRLVTKDALFSSVWDGTVVSESALTSVIKELRRALGDDPKEPRYIQSVYGRGYRLIEPVRELDEESAEPRLQQSGAAGGDRPSAAQPPLLYVPAFEDRQLGPAHPWLAEVLREEVLLALSRFRDLRLVSGTAVDSAAGPSRSYGDRDYQLSVRLLDDTSAIRVFAKIERLETQEIIWADREQLDAGQPARDTDLIIRKIAAAALPRVYDDVAHHLPARTEDAYGRYFQGKLAIRAADSLEEMQAVARDWEALVKAEPGFAPAYAPLIFLYNTDFAYTGLGATTDVERARAYRLASKAAKLDPSEPHLHTVSAWCHLWAGEAALAREHLEQALALNPFHRQRLIEVATALMFLDDLDQAAELLARCETLTPFQTEAPYEETGLLHLLLGNFGKAFECLQRVTRPTIPSQLYSVVAAGALDSPDFFRRVAEWVGQAESRWSGPAPLDADALSAWVLYHHPFQDETRRQWILDLLDPAFRQALPAKGRTPAPARREGLSGPAAVAAAHSPLPSRH